MPSLSISRSTNQRATSVSHSLSEMILWKRSSTLWVVIQLTHSLTFYSFIHLLIDLDFFIIWFSGWRGISIIRSRSLRILFHHNLLLITNPDIECTYMQYTRTCTREIHTYMYTNLHTHSVAYTTYIDTHTHTRLLYAVARMIRRLCRELTCRCRG